MGEDEGEFDFDLFFECVRVRWREERHLAGDEGWLRPEREGSETVVGTTLVGNGDANGSGLIELISRSTRKWPQIWRKRWIPLLSLNLFRSVKIFSKNFPFALYLLRNCETQIVLYINI